jgi:hypothetical protein
MSENTSEFDRLLADLLTGAPNVAVSEITDPGDEPSVVPPPMLKMETIGDTVKFVPSQQVEAVEAAKPQYKQDEGKKPVSGAPFESTVYSRGYLQAKWNEGWRFANKCCLYLNELEALKAFFASPEYEPWLAKCVASGLKKRPGTEG